MAYPDELLDLGISLSRATPETQAQLRRAVSSAYYALFHLLIGDACKNWSRPEQRTRLARRFEHARMLAASKLCIEKYRTAVSGSTEASLFAVAHAFFQVQERRHIADYDMSKPLQAADVALDISLVQGAFEAWGKIQNEQISQEYLFSLLFKDKS
jgi:hypothetical protein